MASSSSRFCLSIYCCLNRSSASCCSLSLWASLFWSFLLILGAGFAACWAPAIDPVFTAVYLLSYLISSPWMIWSALWFIKAESFIEISENMVSLDCWSCCFAEGFNDSAIWEGAPPAKLILVLVTFGASALLATTLLSVLAWDDGGAASLELESGIYDCTGATAWWRCSLTAARFSRAFAYAYACCYCKYC